MKTRNKKDSLTGLLALSADKAPLKKRACLSAEELALLIDGSIPIEQRRELMEHLSHCEICYNQWLVIKSESQVTASSNIFPILSKKSYKYVGSSLAIAASVVVFLNVYTPPVKEVSPVTQDSVILKESSTSYLESHVDIATEPAEEKKRVDEEQVKEIKSTSPAPSKNMQKSYSRGKAERIKSKREVTSPGVENEFSGSAALVMKSSHREKVVDQGSSLEKKEFRTLVIEGCSKSEFDSNYWLELGAKGKNLIETQSFASQVEKEKFIHLTKIIGTIERQTWRDQCGAISLLLAEDMKSR